MRLAREAEQKLATLEAAFQERPIDQAKVYRLADEVGELRAQLLKSRVHSILLIRETLTPEQLRLLVSAERGTR